MGPRTWPSQPAFAHDSERVVWQALRRGLREVDVLLHGLRITDPVDGDVEIDLLVLMPDCGAAIVEVKGGHVSLVNGAIVQTGADGSQVIDPAQQAAKGARALARFLERQPDWSRGRLRHSWQVALPYSHAPLGLGPQLPPHVLICADQLQDIAGLLYDRLRTTHRDTPRFGDNWVDAVLDHILGVRAADAPLLQVPARIDERTRHVDSLTGKQTMLLDVTRNIRRFEVCGPAGTGKSWLAAELAQRWARQGDRVAMVTYTRGVVEWLRDLTATHPPAFLGTFFSLGSTWGVDSHGAEDAALWSADGLRRMLAAAEGLSPDQRFTALIVDEGQDFADDWWEVLLAALAPDARIAVFRDDEQTVFSGRRGRPALDLVPLTLDENLRNCTQIVDAFRPLVQAPVVATAGSAFPIEYWECTAEDVISVADDAVAELVEHRGWLPEHVALLTTRHRHPVHVEQDHDRGGYWATLREPEVFYGTVAGFKGLERPAVIIAVDGFHSGVDPKQVLYTAMSRARDLLVVVGPGELLRAAGGDKLARRLLRGRRTPHLPG